MFGAMGLEHVPVFANSGEKLVTVGDHQGYPKAIKVYGPIGM